MISPYFFLITVGQFIFLVEANDVRGCGGFIKSHIPIDFSKIEVKLVTKQGIVKDRTNCAPNNGYYFLPLYDRGELNLELSPPPGWSFTPKEVTLNIDGSDPCSKEKDINFVFEGFGITGKVSSLGSSFGGPEGILVKLISKDNIRTTETKEDGSFTFSPVFPGSYTVSISHKRWKIYKESVNVQVSEGNTDIPINSLIVQGYDVSGKILTADGNPVPNTKVVLFTQKKDKNIVAVDGCKREEISGVLPKDHYLCHTLTSSSGEFVFPVVPSGNYFVSPYYHEDSIYYQPDKLEFSVQHSSVQLNQHFQVIGFTLHGRVTNGKNDVIPNAKIFLNGKEVAITNSQGKYKLEKLKVGTYQLKAEADNLVFDVLTLNIDTSLKNLPDLVPSAFKVCGKVISDTPQRISFVHSDSSKLIQIESNSNQEFCRYLPPGQYDVSVTVSEEDKQNGLHFFPVTRTIEVTSENIMNLVFSQLKSDIYGKIDCIQKHDCQGLSVILKAGMDELVIPVRSTDLTYSASDIHPGIYEVILSNNNLCWKSSKQTVNINSENVEIPPFIHTGYQVQFISSHEATITYKTLKHGKQIELPIGRGVTPTCLDSPGQYSFSVNSCHEFDWDTVIYNTSSEKNQVTLNAQKHTVELFIQSSKDNGPIQVNLHTGSDKFKQTAHFDADGYTIRLMLKPFETATITPTSDELFFTPQFVQIEGTSDCSDLGPKFMAVEGKVFKGVVQPALSGVKITVQDSTNDKVYLSETDAKGQYKFEPLDSSFEYKISAEKESYLFTEDNGNFKAQKLAEISVEVLDENDLSPLAGVLLSLSGGQSFRRNLQTDSNGRVVFHSLSASDYFLRPMMKEYRFEPTSKLITVKEGETINVELTGKRVAFSAFGKVTTVNEDPVENVNIIASGIDNCTGWSEEATSDVSGSFRIRGLQPYCTFKVYVQTENGHSSAVERTSPEKMEIKYINQDVKDLHITVFRPVLITDVLLKIHAEKVEHYRLLKITLYRESINPSVVYSTSVDNLNIRVDKNRNHGILIHLPSLKLDNNEYSVHLEPAHSIKGTVQIEYFNANTTFRYIEMDFNPKINTKEQPIKQSSIWAMVFILTIILLVYNIQIILDLLKEHLNFNVDGLSSYIPITRNSKSANDYDNDIDQIVHDINNVKKHRPKKTI